MSAVEKSALAIDHWRLIGRLDDIPRLGARVVEFGERKIAVFRTSDDQVFALEDRCPHRGGPLSQGIVHGHCVTCPLHDWVIDLGAGKARAPDEGTVQSYAIRIDGNDILLGLPEIDPASTTNAEATAAEESRVAVVR